MSEERHGGCDSGVRDVCMSEEMHGGCDSGVRDVCMSEERGMVAVTVAYGMCA
jgi:hypothetical protein